MSKLSGDRLLPQNLDAEEAILGGILLDPNAIERVRDNLLPQHFALPSHQSIYREMLTLYIQGKRVDLMTITVQLSDRGLLEKVGGQVKIAQLVERTISAVNIDQYAELVTDKYLRRRLIAAGWEISELGYASAIDIEEVLEQSESQIFNISNTFHNSTELETIANTLVDVFEEIEGYNEGTILPGIPSGFYDLDAITGGFHGSDLVIVAGRTSMGKSAFSLNVAKYLASCQRSVVLFSLEMSEKQLTKRLLAGTAEVDLSKLHGRTKISNNEWEKLVEAIGTLSEEQIFLDDTPNINVAQMRTKCRQLKARSRLDMIILDYLQLMVGDGENRNNELAKITRQLKMLAIELDVPVICLSQLSRSVEGRQDKRPVLSDLRDSGSIEQDADLVLMLYRDEYYNPNTKDPGIAEVLLRKHRNGSTGVIKLLFDRELTQFKNLATRK